MSITGDASGDPVKVGVPICDLACALYCALAAVAALSARERTGEGQLIDVSLFESAMSLAVWEAGRFFTSGEVPGRLGSAHQSSAPYQAVRAQDGWFTVGAATQSTWRAFCEALGLQRLESDPLYAEGNSRFRNREGLVAEVEKVTKTRPVDHWIGLLEMHGVPCSPIQNYKQSFSDPHLLERGYFWDAPHGTAGTVRQLGSPMRFSRTKVRRTKASPLLGEDTRSVLHELGCPDDEIDELLASGVVAEPRGAPRT
jgi:formyl-CoA transferase